MCSATKSLINAAAARVAMCDAYPFAPSLRRIHVLRALRVGYGASPHARSPSGESSYPASPRNRLNASPCHSSSYTQHDRNAVTSGSNAARVARRSRRKITVWDSMSIM
jgi:hypothetical protein